LNRFRAGHPLSGHDRNLKIGRDIFLVAGILFLAGLAGIWTGFFSSLQGDGDNFLFSFCWGDHQLMAWAW